MITVSMVAVLAAVLIGGAAAWSAAGPGLQLTPEQAATSQTPAQSAAGLNPQQQATSRTYADGPEWFVAPQPPSAPLATSADSISAVSALSATVLGGAGLTPHQQAINQTIEEGLAWLAANQQPDGSWPASGANYVAGAGFGAVAFMSQGYTEADLYNGRAVVADAIQYILSQVKPAGWLALPYVEGSIFWGGDPPDLERIHHANYETSVALMALAMTGNPDYADEIAAASAWLEMNQWDDTDPNRVGEHQWSIDGEFLGGFGYQCMDSTRGDTRPDLSNTQLSLVALADAQALSADIANDAITFIQNCQGVRREPGDVLVNLFNTPQSCATNVKWDPTATRIVYNSNYEDTQTACGVYSLKMEVANELARDLAPESVGSMRYSPVADKIAFSTVSGLYLTNSNGTGLEQLELPPGVDRQWVSAWSPDGTKLALTACVGGAGPDIYIYRSRHQDLGSRPGHRNVRLAPGLVTCPERPLRRQDHLHVMHLRPGRHLDG